MNNQSSLTGTLGMYAVNAEDRYDQRGSDLWIQQNTRVRAATGELRHTTIWPARSTDVTVGVSKGMNGLGARKNVETNGGSGNTAQNGGLLGGQLAQLMGISSGGATAMINRLEATGHVRRDRHPLDRRIIVIRPAAAARETLLRERQIVAEEVALLSRRYDTAQRELVHGFLAQCVRAFRHNTLAWLEARRADQLDD